MKNNRKHMAFLRFLGIFRTIKMPWLLILLNVALQLINYFITIRVAKVTGDIIDTTGFFDSVLLVNYILTVAGASLLTAIANPVNTIACEKINLGLRRRLWQKIIRLPQSCYAEDRGETLVSRITSDCDYASTLLVVAITVVTTISGLGMYLKQMYSFNPGVANYVLLVFIPSSMLMGWVYGKLQYWVSKKNQRKLSDATVYLIERVKNLNLIKSTNMEGREETAGDHCFREQAVVSFQNGLVGNFYIAIGTFLSIMTLLLTVLLGSRLIEQGLATAGTVISFYLVAGQVSSTFSRLINLFGSVRGAMGALERVVTVLETPEEDLESGDTIDIPDQDIHLEEVDFTYNTHSQVLQQLSCSINKKEVTAIIGANGSGKSTLMKLLARLLEPNNGAIYFGDRNIQEFNLHAWRKAVGVVSQDCVILEGTLRENILYGCDREVGSEELMNVCRQANLEKLIQSLPDGLDTHVLSGGSNFSGGQRQCIAIARAIMRNPDYLLLDEATSNLDPKSERVVLDALHNLMKNRTTVVIAHKLSALRYADRVLVVKDGRIAQCGTPQDIVSDW